MSDDKAEYVTDAPITEAPQDRFSRAPFAERIARTIIAQRDPASLVVGLYGPWGDGKTSALNLVEHALAGADGIVPVRFNPWRLGNETEMFVGFFETLAEALDAKLTTGAQKVGEVLKRYGGLLKPIPFTGGAVGEAAAAAGAALSETSLAKARARIEEILAESGKRVVILMDDLDRLDKAEIQAIFRLVKVAADFEHTAYVLAFDASVVADALAERYAPGTSHGMSFMEKIIQLPLHLPPVGSDLLRQVTLETVDVALEQAGTEMSRTEIGEFVSTFDRAVVPRIKTPRIGKRYGNAVLFALPMIGDEVRPVDLLLIEAMRIFYPRLYEWVRTHEEEVIGQRSMAQGKADGANAVLREVVAEATTGMAEDEVRGAQVLLTTLFPRTESAWQNKHWGSDWDSTWAKERRIASGQYFRRYFTYTVPAGDLRDADVDALIALLADPDHDGGEVADLARQLIDRGGPETFLQKVGTHLDAMSSEASARLVVLLAAFSDLLPDHSGFMSLSTMERAALLASKLVERLAPEERLGVVAAVMKAAQSIPFAVELVRWIRPQDGEVKTLTLEETAKAGRLLLERIIPVWEGDDPFSALGKGVAGTLHVWVLYGDADELRACLARLIGADISNAFRLMGAFLGQAWSMESGVPLMPEFRREAYNAVAEYIDAADLFSRLQDRFGEAVGTGEFYSFRELPPEDRMANEFAFIHRVVLDERRAKDEAPPEAAQE
ncbi:MAG TPA: P-loop NTPase fold protein [Acidimicrobiales bacterium]|nr:P-loop NTPase fold protein [Acidimicrobiales bacterium]